MLFLVGSIVLTAYLTISFKVVGLLKINTFQTIVFNYITCVFTGSLFNGRFPVDGHAVQQPWFPWAVFMGTLFISIFNVVGLTTQRAGISVTSVAYKLSLVIPFMFSLYWYREPFTWLKLAGMLVTIAAVVLVLRPAAGTDEDTVRQRNWLLPVLLFVSSGLLDTLVKYTEQRFLDGSNNNDFLVTAFASAASIGTLLLLIMLLTGRQQFDYRAVLAGAAIGFPNYFSIWCLMRVLKQHTGNSSAIIPINNMGIVLVSALAAALLFREKMSALNWLGIALSLAAIALIAFG